MIFDNLRINDYRKEDGVLQLEARNLTYVGNHPWTSFYCAPAGMECKREYLFENIIVDGIDGYGYGCEFFRIAPTMCTIRNMQYKNTEKLFGFSSFDKRFENVSSEGTFSLRIVDSIFENLTWQKGITLVSQGDFKLEIDKCVFNNCMNSEDCESLFSVKFSEESTLSVKDTVISGSDGKRLIDGDISSEQVVLENCKICELLYSKNNSLVFTAKELVNAYIETALNNLEDKHDVAIGNFSVLEASYSARKPFYCDMHVHSRSGGTSDGCVDIGEWPNEMQEKKVDFVAIADHRQMRHFFLPEFDDAKFFYANEPEDLLQGGSV